MSIEKLIDLHSEFQKEGFFYSKDLIFNYFISLISKPFLILTGISGSGKSKIAELFANKMSADKIKNYELIPVKPNWRDSKGLFGYHNVIDGSYYITPTIKLFIRALNNPNIPFFLVLDEMNIAKTEHYFADYLSLIESRRMSYNKTFSYNSDAKLSEAIILAAFDIDKQDEFLSVEEYRSNRFSQEWKNKFFRGKEESWLPQFRTELNQGDNRLAHRVFEGNNGYYRLKKIENIAEEDRKVIENLKKRFLEYVISDKKIIQDSFLLHNNNKCISNTGIECACEECIYTNSEKHKCKRLYNKEAEMYFVPPEIPIPLNLFTIGTVNVDETTYMFSPKVLDRSNVIEFNDVDLETLYELSESEKEQLTPFSVLSKVDSFYFKNDLNIAEFKIKVPNKFDVIKFKSNDSENFNLLLRIFSILKKYNMHFGYRVINEIALYMCNVFDRTDCANASLYAFDNQILQKILPKFSGSHDKLWNPLVEILSLLLLNKQILPFEVDDLIKELNKITEQNNCSLSLNTSDCEKIFKYPKSAIKILKMLSDLNSFGFANYIK